MNIKIRTVPGLEAAAKQMGMTVEEAAEHFVRTELKSFSRNLFARNRPSKGRIGAGGDVVMFKRRPRAAT